jgi:hypothetical protein
MSPSPSTKTDYQEQRARLAGRTKTAEADLRRLENDLSEASADERDDDAALLGSKIIAQDAVIRGLRSASATIDEREAADLAKQAEVQKVANEKALEKAHVAYLKAASKLSDDLALFVNSLEIAKQAEAALSNAAGATGQDLIGQSVVGRVQFALRSQGYNPDAVRPLDLPPHWNDVDFMAVVSAKRTTRLQRHDAVMGSGRSDYGDRTGGVIGPALKNIG